MVLNNFKEQKENPREKWNAEAAELLETALSQNAYEKSDWYGIEKERSSRLLGIWFLWGIAFLAASIVVFLNYRKWLDGENEKLLYLLEQGIPML